MINEACFHNILSVPSKTKDPSVREEGTLDFCYHTKIWLARPSMDRHQD